MIRFLLKIFLILALIDLNRAEFKENEIVTLFVNKVGPYGNKQETYHYYTLPVCRPKEIVHKKLKLGELLDGDRMAESVYNISYKTDKPKTSLCESFTINGNELKQLQSAIEENYYFEFVIDDIPVRNFIGRVDEESIFPHNHKVFLFTHHHFTIEYNEQHIITAKVDVEREPPVRLDNVDTVEVTYTYSVEWKKTNIKREDRDKLLADSGFFPKSFEIHWLSVINSSLLVFLLLGFVILILVRVVRSDLIKYNYNPKDQEKLDEYDDHGWKVIHGDVFRLPKYASLLSAILGVGCQLLVIVITILIVVLFRVIDKHTHGLINVASFILYALTSCIAGYISACMYRKMNGKNWVSNINLASCLFSVPMFLVWLFENSVSVAYQSTQALPYTTVLLLLAIWILVGYPLTIVGGVLGKNFAGRLDTPCRTRNIPRELPPLPYYHSCPVFCLVGGFLPFSAISVELYYIFATIWGHESYTLFGVLLIVFVILLSVTACVSIALTYFQLSAEDYRWWWRSLFVGGSTGFFVFIYSIFFYVKRSEMTGFFQTAQFFGYILLLCYGFFLCLGTVSFFASLKFVRYIYNNIKTD